MGGSHIGGNQIMLRSCFAPCSHAHTQKLLCPTTVVVTFPPHTSATALHPPMLQQVSVVCIGGGGGASPADGYGLSAGGAGGGLGWGNGISVRHTALVAWSGAQVCFDTCRLCTNHTRGLASGTLCHGLPSFSIPHSVGRAPTGWHPQLPTRACKSLPLLPGDPRLAIHGRGGRRRRPQYRRRRQLLHFGNDREGRGRGRRHRGCQRSHRRLVLPPQPGRQRRQCPELRFIHWIIQRRRRRRRLWRSH